MPARATHAADRIRIAKLLVAACACLPVAAWAQTPAPEPPGGAREERISPDLEPYEGRPIRRVVLQVAGEQGSPPVALSEADEALARNQLRLREGAPFSARAVSQDLSRLNRLGRFRQLQATVQPLDSGAVDLVYTVQLQPVIAAVQTVGNKLISDEALAPLVDMLVGTPTDPAQLDRACRRIEDMYRDRGYFNARVTVDEKELASSGTALFNVREGERTRVAEIRFDGATSISARELKSKLKTKEAWLLERGPVEPETIADDAATIGSIYRDRGFLDVRVDRTITASPNGKEAIVTFIVEEGRMYTMRDLRLSIADDAPPVLTPEQMMGLIRIKPGDTYSERMLKDSEKAIKSALGQMGYADADVVRRDLRVPGEPLVDVALLVRQGKPYKTGLIEVRGNTNTRDDVVRRAITLRPDRPLDTTQLEESERRLRVARIFADPGPESPGPRLAVQPEDPMNPGYRDVIAEVQETNTGSFQFGAGLSSDAGVIGQFIVTQRNFDIHDYPDTFGDFFTGQAFRGGGQTASLAILPGTLQQTFAASLSDPYLGGTDFNGAVRAELRRRQYTKYDELRYGASFTVGRRFGSLWTVKAPVKVESVRLSSIDSDAPTDFFDVEDPRTLLSAGVSLQRSSVDDPAFPSKGSNAEFSIIQYGGDDTFTRVTAEYSRYFKLDEDVTGLKTSLQLTGKVGYVPQDMSSVPFYERFYLGGQTFRGFGFRGIGPVGVRHDTGVLGDEQIGGKFQFFLGAEVRKPLYTELVSGVLFIDTGTIDDDVKFDHYRASAGFGLRLYVKQVSPVPLAFDFGIPLLKQSTDTTRLFTFSLDVPF